MTTVGRWPTLEELALDQLLGIWSQLLLWTGTQPTIEYMVHADLTFSELVVLRMLERAPLSVADVAECISVKQPTASRVVDRLVQGGYVARQENPEDRRQKQLTLTGEGQKLVDQVEASMAAAAAPVAGVLTHVEQEQLRHLLTKMIAGQCAGISVPSGIHQHLSLS